MTKIYLRSSENVKIDLTRAVYFKDFQMREMLEFTRQDIGQRRPEDPEEFTAFLGYVANITGLDQKYVKEGSSHVQVLPWGLNTLRRFLEAIERFHEYALGVELPPREVPPEDWSGEDIRALMREIAADMTVRFLREHLRVYEGHRDLLRADRDALWTERPKMFEVFRRFLEHSEGGKELMAADQPQA